jgi:hypothetical protein
MGPCFVVFLDLGIQIDLQLVDRTIHLRAERDSVELIEHCFVKALADAMGLRALGFGARRIDALASSSNRTLARMIFYAAVIRSSYSVVVVSSNRRGGALRHPDRSAPRLGLRFAVGNQGTYVKSNLS